MLASLSLTWNFFLIDLSTQSLVYRPFIQTPNQKPNVQHETILQRLFVHQLPILDN